MSWQTVKIKVEGVEFEAMIRGDEIYVPMMVDETLPLVEVDGQPREVVSVRVDERDNVVYITVKEADAKKRRKSDDEPAEGRSTDNAGGEEVQDPPND